MFGLNAPNPMSILNVLGQGLPTPMPGQIPMQGVNSISSIPKARSPIYEMVAKHHSKNKNVKPRGQSYG